MKFDEYVYQHMDVKDLENKIHTINNTLQQAPDYTAFFKAFHALDDLEKDIDTNATLCEIRHSVDTGNSYYKNENEYLDEILPQIQAYLNKTSDIILHSPYVDQLKKDVPQTYFLSKEMEKKSFSPAIVSDLQEENKLASQYQALVASAEIDFEGKIYNLSGLSVKMSDSNRNVRKKATKAYWNWFTENEEELGNIFDQLVKVRTIMAKKMGYKNYIEMGYYRMNRFDYDQNDVANYRKQILACVVPLDNELYERQRKRLGIDQLYAWDEKVEFEQSPKPKYDRKEMVQRALKMYQELSNDTGIYFKYMIDHDLMDLDSKPRKASGGYCTFIPNYHSPFIFANFNGTSGDTEVLTHEAGHGYQVYSSQNIFPSSCIWPTYESCEIHSMSMEFFTYPWMHLFYEEDTDKYYYNHLAGTVKFLPYGVLVDHFQHEVYAHPEWQHNDRMACWRKLERQYLPHKNYTDIDILERGGWWLRQLHIFMDPFYYIDYTLAQVCALQFWARMQKKDPYAFEDYEKICKVGGTLTFRQIVKRANLKVPFEDGCLDETIQEVRKWFQKSTL